MHQVIDQRLRAIEKAIEKTREAIVKGDKDLAAQVERFPNVQPLHSGITALNSLRQEVAHLRAFLNHEQLATHLVRVLNQALAADSKAVQELADHRVRLVRTKAWARHPQFTALQEGGKVVVGLVGIINGFRFSDEEPRIAARYDSQDQLVEFILMEEEEEKENRGSQVSDAECDPRVLVSDCR